MPRTLAIGDIHGCLTALDTLLGFVLATKDDTLVFLGDFVDRGPDTRGVIERLIELKQRPRTICLRGNHEIMMLQARGGHDDFRFWSSFGGVEAIESYGVDGQIATMDAIPDSHWSFLERTLDQGFETDTHIFVHANLHPDNALDEQRSEWIHWEPLRPNMHRPHVSGKTMICGHTQQREGLPLVLEKAICIDTWAYGKGWLTCLDVVTGEFWQANELGKTRSGIVGASGAYLIEAEPTHGPQL